MVIPADPSSPYNGVISKFVDNVSKNKPPVIFDDGSATRDFVSVHGVISRVMLLLENLVVVGKSFNCDMGSAICIDDLVRTVIDLYGKDLWPEHRQERPRDITDRPRTFKRRTQRETTSKHRDLKLFPAPKPGLYPS